MKLNIEVTCAECSSKLTAIIEPTTGVFDLKLKVFSCESCKEAGEQAAVLDYQKTAKKERLIEFDVVINQQDTQNVAIKAEEK